MSDGKKSNLGTDLAEYALAGFMLWLSAHPEKIDAAQERVTETFKKIRHSLSIGQALRAIRKLPETEVTDVTEMDRE